MKQSARGPKWRTAHSPPPMPGKASDFPLELWKLSVLAGCLERVKSGNSPREHMLSGLPRQADIRVRSQRVRLVPKAGSCGAAKMKSLFDHLIGALFVPNLTYA
jgi:hypothetical protein